MPHPRVQAHRATYQARASGVRAQLAQAERREQARTDLTASQRRRNIGHLRRMAEQQLAQLRQEFEAGKPNILAAIRAPVYKLPPSTTGILEWRDACDRAGQVEDQDQAMVLWERAALVGDQVMQTALGYLACPRPGEYPPRWPKVIDAWRRDPFVRDTLAEHDQAWQELDDPGQQYQDGLLFRMPPEQTGPDPDALPQLQPVPDPGPTGAGQPSV
jgi:hypothetical protein